MQVFHSLEEATQKIPASAVAIGNFDGCHRGHVALLNDMRQYAVEKGLASTVLTFFPHPVEVLNPAKKLERLTTTSEKLARLQTLGVEYVFVAPFTTEVAELSPESFYANYLRTGLHANSMHVGFNFHFGKNRGGNTTLLKQWCERDNSHLGVLPPFEWKGTRVSSSAVRSALLEGNVTQAAEWLGRAYSVRGQVSHGDQRGQLLGFPTANLQIPHDKVLPKNGVYVTRARWQEQWYRSVTNVGVRPTFGGENLVPRLEVHLLNFNARIYDETIELTFLDRIRDEMKFSSVDALKAQIEKDVKEAENSHFFSAKG